MTTREHIIAAAKEADPGFGGGPDADGTMTDSIVGIDAVERFYTIAFNDGFRSCSDELCEKCGKTRQHAGGGCIHCITEWCKEKVREAHAERDAIANQTKEQCAALCYEQNWLVHGSEMSALILATKEEVK